MPAKAPKTPKKVADRLVELGQQIRQHRKQLRLSATVTAEAAGTSRVTLHRIEKGEASVTMGAWLSAMDALGLDFGFVDEMDQGANQPDELFRDMIPVRIPLADYPQLKKLAWQVQGVDTLTPLEALGIYQRNMRHIDMSALEPKEQQLIEALQLGLADRHNV